MWKAHDLSNESCWVFDAHGKKLFLLVFLVAREWLLFARLPVLTTMHLFSSASSQFLIMKTNMSKPLKLERVEGAYIWKNSNKGP